MNAQLQLLGIEAAEHMAFDLRCKDFCQDGPDPQHHGHYRHDDGKRFLCVLFFVLGQKSRVDRNKGDGGSSPGNEVVQPVGDGEAGDISVGLRTRAERPGDVGLAHIADDAREHDRRHEQQRRREGCVLVRRPQQAQKAVHLF
jgi:hypothetical protein